MQVYFATVALLKFRCLSFDLCVFTFVSFLVLHGSCKKNSCGNLPSMHLRLDTTVSLAAGAVLLVGREVCPVMAMNC